MWMTTFGRFIAVVMLIVGVLGCASPDKSTWSDPVPGDVQRLVGSWDLQLHPPRVVPLISRDPAASGRLTLEPLLALDSSAAPALVPGTAGGHIGFHRFGALLYRPGSDSALAFIAENGQLRIELRVTGIACSDCGNLYLVGRFKGACATGTWEQEFLSGGTGGRFTLTPADPDSRIGSLPPNVGCS